jgi:SAM-dependent methyltransferase
MNQKWNDRYKAKEFAYGEEPNKYLEEQLPKFPPGHILFPAEGEGRNAVYAASLGWKVSAFDLSEEGKKKAMHLAGKRNVTINYTVGEFETVPFAPNTFDAVALIYAHFPADKKSRYHQVLATYLRPGGIIIFEAFSKNHLAYNSRNEKVGGPKNIDELFSVAEIKADFNNFEIIELMEKEVELNEGLYHIGKGSVIRFVGRKVHSVD